MQNNRLLAILLCRCPICLRGAVFHSLLGMNADCPLCGIHFERETGYFLNAMFFAYVLGFLILAPTMLYLYFQQVSTLTFTLVVTIETLLLWPWVFRYSRVLWLHTDQLIDPRHVPQNGVPQNGVPENGAPENRPHTPL
jgi:uncharacterized protein (DUF983 family)